jgi:hypothetical protein
MRPTLVSLLLLTVTAGPASAQASPTSCANPMAERG